MPCLSGTALGWSRETEGAAGGADELSTEASSAASSLPAAFGSPPSGEKRTAMRAKNDEPLEVYVDGSSSSVEDADADDDEGEERRARGRSPRPALPIALSTRYSPSWISSAASRTSPRRVRPHEARVR